MEITSFLLGICAVIVVALVTVVVVGMFKISRLNKELNNLEGVVNTEVPCIHAHSIRMRCLFNKLV